MQIAQAYIKGRAAEKSSILHLTDNSGAIRQELLPQGLMQADMDEATWNPEMVKTYISDNPENVQELERFGDYVLSKYILLSGGAYSRPAKHLSSGEISFAYVTPPPPYVNAYSLTWIPLKRLSGYKKVYMYGRLLNGASTPVNQNYISARTATVISDSDIQYNACTILVPQATAEWQLMEWDISNRPYIDYICFVAHYGQPQYKDIWLEA